MAHDSATLYLHEDVDFFQDLPKHSVVLFKWHMTPLPCLDGEYTFLHM